MLSLQGRDGGEAAASGAVRINAKKGRRPQLKPSIYAYIGGKTGKTSVRFSLKSARRCKITSPPEGLVEIDAALRYAEGSESLWCMPEVLRIKGSILAKRDPPALAAAEDHFDRSLVGAPPTGAFLGIADGDQPGRAVENSASRL